MSEATKSGRIGRVEITVQVQAQIVGDWGSDMGDQIELTIPVYFGNVPQDALPEIGDQVQSLMMRMFTLQANEINVRYVNTQLKVSDAKAA